MPELIRDNSLEAWIAGNLSGNFANRKADILRWLDRNGPATERQIKDALQLEEMNYVRPRVTELVKDGVLAEAGSTKCPTTGRTVRIVMLAETPARQGELF